MKIKDINIWKKDATKEMNISALRNASLDDLGLASRAFNGLKRAGCTTVGDVLDIIENDGSGLKGIRNLGEKSEKEILISIEKLREAYQESIDSNMSSENYKAVLLKPNGSTWLRNIDTYSLSDKARANLSQNGVHFIGDLYSNRPACDPSWCAVRELFSQIISKMRA